MQTLGAVTVVVGAAVLGGCSHIEAQRFVGPHGEPMAYVSCGSNPPRCYELARQECGGNFDIVGVERQTATVTRSETNVSTTAPVSLHEFTVVCADANAAAEASRRQQIEQTACGSDADCPSGFACHRPNLGQDGECKAKK